MTAWTDPSPTTGDQLLALLRGPGLPALRRVVRLIRAATAAEALELAPPVKPSRWTPSAGARGTEAEVLGCYLHRMSEWLRGGHWNRTRGRAESRAVQRRDLAAMLRLGETASERDELRAAWPSDAEELLDDLAELPSRDPDAVALYPAARRELELLRLSNAALGIGTQLAAEMGKQPYVDYVKTEARRWHGELEALASERRLIGGGGA